MHMNRPHNAEVSEPLEAKLKSCHEVSAQGSRDLTFYPCTVVGSSFLRTWMSEAPPVKMCAIRLRAADRMRLEVLQHSTDSEV